MNTQQLQAMATLKNKEVSMYEDISYSRGIPTQVPMYEISFELEDGQVLHASVSQFEYDVVEQGDQGLLIYTPHKHHKDIQNHIDIVSFADILIDFKMDS